MDERSQILVTTMVGAFVGCVLGVLYKTQGGKNFREQIESVLDSAIDELQKTQDTFEKARKAAEEGRRTLDKVLNPNSSSETFQSERDFH